MIFARDGDSTVGQEGVTFQFEFVPAREEGDPSRSSSFPITR